MSFMCIEICMNIIYIPKYNLFSIYDVYYMCVFRVDCLALDKSLMYSSLGETTYVYKKVSPQHS